jgi:hypothetical protein
MGGKGDRLLCCKGTDLLIGGKTERPGILGGIGREIGAVFDVFSSTTGSVAMLSLSNAITLPLFK